MIEDYFANLNRHIHVSRETYDKLQKYHDLLIKWQAKINLVSNDSLDQAWTRHFLDSLQLMKFIPNLSDIMIDFGSGAGFPGMVLAICGAEKMNLIESDSRKAAFLREVTRVTNTNVAIHNCRIENLKFSQKAKIIVSRACSNLDTLLNYSFPYVSHETICLFPKGKNYSKDIDDANEHWMFSHTIIPSVTDSEGVILKLTDIEKRGI